MLEGYIIVVLLFITNWASNTYNGVMVLQLQCVGVQAVRPLSSRLRVSSWCQMRVMRPETRATFFFSKEFVFDTLAATVHPLTVTATVQPVGVSGPTLGLLSRRRLAIKF